jgi:hypothetical protein
MATYSSALKKLSQKALLKEALKQHDRAEKAEKALTVSRTVIQRCEEDINWMLNNEKFLNPSVFEYLHEAAACFDISPETSGSVPADFFDKTVSHYLHRVKKKEG